MSQELARFIVRAAAVSVIWSILTAMLNIPGGWWFMGQLAFSALLLAHYRARLLRATREPERPGPRAEWID